VWSAILCAEGGASPDAPTIRNRVDKGRSSAEKSLARYSALEAGAAFAVIAPEQGKNREEKFSRPFSADLLEILSFLINVLTELFAVIR
jgi:hypothetical protein